MHSDIVIELNVKIVMLVIPVENYGLIGIYFT